VSAYHCKESNHDTPDVQPIVCSLYRLSYVHKTCSWWILQSTDLKLMLKIVFFSDSPHRFVNQTLSHMNKKQHCDIGSEHIGWGFGSFADRNLSTHCALCCEPHNLQLGAREEVVRSQNLYMQAYLILHFIFTFCFSCGFCCFSWIRLMCCSLFIQQHLLYALIHFVCIFVA